MRYCGSKKRYAKYIIPYLIGAIKDENTTFIDMCGVQLFLKCRIKTKLRLIATNI